MALIKTNQRLTSSEKRRLEESVNKEFGIFKTSCTKEEAKAITGAWSRNSAGYGFLGLETRITSFAEANPKNKRYVVELGGIRKDHYKLLIDGWRHSCGDEVLKLLKQGKISLQEVKIDY